MSGWAWFAMLGGLAGFAWAVWPSRVGLAIPAPVGGSLWLVSGLVLCAESLFISDPKGGLSQAKATQLTPRQGQSGHALEGTAFLLTPLSL